MTIVSAGITAVDMNQPDLGSLVYGDPTVVSQSFISLQTGAWTDEFRGDFQFDASGQLAGGTLASWVEKYSGQTVFQVTGAAVPVSTFLNWVRAGDDHTAVTTILSGADSVTGSAYGDVLEGFAGDDTINGGDGQDTVQGGLGADAVFGDAGDDIVRDDAGANYLRGGDGNDQVWGGADFDDTHGNIGNDTVHGGGSGDWVLGGQGNDMLYGDDGNDLVFGNLGSDTLSGGAGDDGMQGGQQNDSLDGGAGNDFLSGDRGDDTLTGGAGADVFHASPAGGVDRVTDFHLSEGDRVQIDAGAAYTVTQAGADTVIDMGGGNQMILVGVDKATLTGAWIFEL